MTKFTKTEKLDAIITGMETGNFTIDKNILIEFCNHEKELLAKKSAKAKDKADELIDAVANALTAEMATIADITAIVGGDATVSKVQYRLNKLAEAGVAVKGEVSVPAVAGGKPRKVVAYAKA